MNWQAMSFDWNQARAFLAAAEEGSFSGAARVLDSTQPTIGRQIASLESALGVTLMERGARGPRLTDAGRGLLEHVRAMGEAASLVSLAAVGHSQDIAGEVVVTATDLMSSATLPRILAPLRRAAPALRLRLIASNDVQDLMRREADIAIRHARPSQPDLIARRVGDFRANLYGATSYFETHGRPRNAREAGGHAFLGLPDPERLIAPLNAMGVPVRADNFVMTSDNGVVVWELLKAGHGLAMQPEPLAEAEPNLEKALPDLPSVQFPIWLVTHRELRTNPRIRMVFDALSRGLADLAVPPGA